VKDLLLLMGHRSEATLFDYYYKAMTGAEAASYWQIMPPPSEERRILAFSA
jgi:hypothetical protein